MEVARSSKGIVVSQRKYVLELLTDTGLSGVKPCRTPLEQNIKFTSKAYGQHINQNIADHDLEDTTVFKRLMGKLIYLTLSISYMLYKLLANLCMLLKTPIWKGQEGLFNTLNLSQVWDFIFLQRNIYI